MLIYRIYSSIAPPRYFTMFALEFSTALTRVMRHEFKTNCSGNKPNCSGQVVRQEIINLLIDIMILNKQQKFKLGLTLLGGVIGLATIYAKYRSYKKIGKEKISNSKELIDYKKKKDLETYEEKLKIAKKYKEAERNSNAEVENTFIPTPIEENPNEILARLPVVPVMPELLIEGVLRNKGVNWVTSRTGQGKSILAVQLGIEAMTGEVSKLVPPGKGQIFPPYKYLVV